MLTNLDTPSIEEWQGPKYSLSEHATLTRCKKKHDYAYRQGLSPASPPSYLSKGKYLHLLLATYLTRFSNGDDVRNVEELSSDVLEQLSQARLDGDPTATVAESDRVEINRVVADYLSHLDMDGVTVEGVELEFLVDIDLRTLDDEIVPLHGFIDAVLRKGDELWIVEHKTAGRAWSQGNFQFAYQGRVYADVWKELMGEAPTGILYNFFYPKAHDTKMVFVTEAESLIIREELQAAVEMREAAYLTREPHWGCTECWFRNICVTEMYGGDSSSLIGTEYVVDEAKVARFQVED